MKMKRMLAGVCSVGIAIIIYGCSFVTTQTKSENGAEIELTIEKTENEKADEKADLSRGDLFTMFEEVNNETVIDFLYDDYNKDGQYEAFVLTREDTEKLWYMSSDGCEIVLEDLGENGNSEADILTYSVKDYLLLQREKNGKKNTLVYSIDNDNMVIEINISGKGYLYQNQEGELFLQVAEDENTALQNDTYSYCNYYLYYALDEGFKEYGGIPVAEEQFLEFEGAQEILDGLYQACKDYEVEYSFLYRSNHYIDINITLRKDGKIEFKHMTVKYDLYKVTSVSDELMEGKVETAHILSIATYPIAFKHPIKEMKN